MLYYADRRYTILQNRNRLYDIYDGKYKKNNIYRNQTREQVDSFIKERQNRSHASYLDSMARQKAFAGANITLRHSLSLEKASLITRLLEIEDFSNCPYPWLNWVLQLALEYLMLKDLPDTFRVSQIPQEILNICETAINKTE